MFTGKSNRQMFLEGKNHGFLCLDSFQFFVSGDGFTYLKLLCHLVGKMVPACRDNLGSWPVQEATLT